MRFIRLPAICILCLWAMTRAGAFPEFQRYSQRHSGVPTDCAMCRINPGGPVGSEFGQIGSLNAQDQARLNQARAALNPGQVVDNPILNAFGDRIVQTLGMLNVLQLRSDPAGLAPALGTTSDLDKDGIPDSTEYLDGTNPLDPESGKPGLLLGTRLARHWISLVFAILALGLLLYGLLKLRQGVVRGDE